MPGEYSIRLIPVQLQKSEFKSEPDLADFLSPAMEMAQGEIDRAAAEGWNIVSHSLALTGQFAVVSVLLRR